MGISIMKIPIIKPILIFINAVILGIALSSLIVPLLGCVVHLNIRIADWLALVFFILSIIILYAFNINQKKMGLLSIAALFLAFLMIKIFSVDFINHLFEFLWLSCSDLHPTGENPTFGFFVMSFLFMAWLALFYVILFICHKIKIQ